MGVRCVGALCVAAALAHAQAPAVQPLVITADTVFDPATTYGPIVIKGSNITVDGRGAWVIGATQGDPKDYTGNGVAADGVSGVTLKNLNVKGFSIGLKVEHGSKWLVENCNFSDNFHYPEAGWGEQPPRRHRLRVRRSFHAPQEPGPPRLGRLHALRTPTTT